LRTASGLTDGNTYVGAPQRPGRELPLTPTRLLLPGHDRLLAVDPLTGIVLWSRGDVKSGARLLHDQANVYVVHLDRAGKATRTAAYRLADGTAVPISDFSDLYNRSRAVTAGRLLLVEEPAGGGVLLRLFHPGLGRSVWELPFRAGSKVVESLHPGLTGVVGPGGVFHLVEAATGRVLWKAAVMSDMRVQGLPADVKSIRLVADAQRIYLGFERALKKDEAPEPHCEPLFQPWAGLQAVPVHGLLHTYDRATGKLFWYNDLDRQMLLVGAEVEHLPVLVFAARAHRHVGPARLRRTVTSDNVLMIHKRNGKIQYLREAGSRGQAGFIVGVDGDPEGNAVRVLGDSWTVELKAVQK
jgi:hypothetical protein